MQFSLFRKKGEWLLLVGGNNSLSPALSHHICLTEHCPSQKKTMIEKCTISSNIFI